MGSVSADKTDRAGYDDQYKDNVSGLNGISDRDTYIATYDAKRIGPYYTSGVTKGYVRGEAVKRLIADADRRRVPRSDIVVLDAGSGQGELSVYLACVGFKVFAVDISSEAKACGESMASKIGVLDECTFLAESLEKVSIPDVSVDYVIGHASLHHFIKYEGVPGEFLRVMKDNARGYFADAFGENRLFHIFHDKEKMRRLGDVSLTKKLVDSYFSDFDVTTTPTDWFVMLDKLYLKVLPKDFIPIIRKLSRIHNWLDRRMPDSSRIALSLSGSVLTEIRKH